MINVGRAGRPALAGVLIAAAGSGAVFAINAVSFVGALVVLARWRRPTPPPPGPRENVSEARRRRREVRALHTHTVGDPDHATDVEITSGGRDDATLLTIVGAVGSLGAAGPQMRERNQRGWSVLLPHYRAAVAA